MAELSSLSLILWTMDGCTIVFGTCALLAQSMLKLANLLVRLYAILLAVSQA